MVVNQDLPSKNGVIGDGLAARDHHVRLASQTLRNLAVGVRELRELDATTKETQINTNSNCKCRANVNLLAHEGAELSTGRLGFVCENETLTGHGARCAAKRDCGEGLNIEVGAIRAAGDEGRGQREDGAGTQGRIEGGRDRLGASGLADEGLVTALDRDNGGSSAESRGICDERSGTKIADSLVS